MTTRGFIRPMRGRELVAYQGIEARLDILIHCRYNPAVRVLPEYQVLYVDGYGVTHTYLIFDVIDVDEKRHALDLICEERHIA